MISSFALILKKKSETFQALLEEELRTFWKESSIINQSGIKEIFPVTSFIPKAFADPCDYFFHNNSKKLRPILGELLLQTFGSGCDKPFRRILILPEILHSASLIVDDIEDSANIRRGKPCLHIKCGVDTAINLSNALYFLPFHCINHSRLSSGLKQAISHILTEAMNRIHLGQGLDIFWHKNNLFSITPEQYETMARLKTSSFFRAEAQLAIQLSGKKQNALTQTLTLAENIGVAFQIIDDVLDLSPDRNHKFGKQLGQDIIEGKKTLIVALAMKRGSKKEKAELIHILGLHSPDERIITQTIALFNKLDCILDARNHAENLIDKSWDSLTRTLKPSRNKELLHYYCKFLVQRTF